MTKSCARCGEGFEAKNARATFCSDRCRKAASRAGGRVDKVATPSADVPDTPRTDADVVTPSVTAATVRELVEANRLDTALGAAALLAACRLDGTNLADTGASVAALIREHRAALAAALVDGESAADPVDDLRGAVLRVIRGGAA